MLTTDHLFGGDLRAFVDAARMIEDAGIDGIVMPDHVVFGNDVRYPFGGWTLDSAASWPEPMAVLSAIAGATQRVDLLTNVIVAPLRSAALLAKQAATLYGLSGGRFQLGVGTGWMREEFDASGVEFSGRSAALFDQLKACRALWHERPASYHSDRINFDDIWCVPGLPGDAAQSPLKLWFGVAPTASNARFFEEFGGGWSSIYPDPKAIAEGRGALQAALQARGIATPIPVRAAPPIQYDSSGAPDLARTIDSLPLSIAAGATEFDFPLMFYVRERGQFDGFLKALSAIPRS
jgi:alkanesulfonate monooxygenase SsuD/methylene tetrahydromethanopterin reductase-like flavin-dependent oxidoreductase (luciferase family)